MSNKPNIYQRINAIMAEVSYVQKENKKVNNQYTFVSHDAVTASLQPALVKHGVVVAPSVLAHNQDGNRTEVDVQVDFINIDNPEDKFSVNYFGYGIDPQDKGPGKAFSYAKKYAFLQVFCLETGDDPERDSIDHKPEPKTKPQTTRAKTAVGKDVREACADLGNIQDKNELEGFVGSKQWKALAAECKAEHPDMYQTMVATYQTTKARIETGGQNSPDDVEYVADQYIERLKTQMNADDCNTIAQEGIRALLAADADASIIKAVEDAMKARCAEIAGGAK